MTRIVASFAIASVACIAATAACARDVAQPPCVVDITCVRVPVAPHPREAALGRLPGYADPAERDGAKSPIAAAGSVATEWQATGEAPWSDAPSSTAASGSR